MSHDDSLEIPLADGASLAARFDPGGGSETWLVYLHGLGSTQDGDKVSSFRSWSREAGLGFASFDFRGHGDSGGSMFDLTLSRNIEDLRAVLDALAIRHPRSLRRTVLLGSSMGALTAMWLCARQARRVAAAVLIAPALGMANFLERSAGSEGMVRWQRRGSIVLDSDLVSAELGWELIADLRRHRVGDLLQLYRTESLVLQGLKDETVPAAEVVDFVQRSTADIDCVLYGAGDHRLTREKIRLWSAILDFLSFRNLL